MALAAPVLEQAYRYPPEEARASLERFAAMGGKAGRLARSILSRR